MGKSRVRGAALLATPQDVALLQQWNSLHTGLRTLVDQVLGEVEEKTGLAPSSFQVLWFLLRSPEMAAPMNQLSETLGFTTAGTTKVADRLADAGLMERRAVPADRRITLAALTTRGKSEAAKAGVILAGALRERIADTLGEDKFATLVESVGILATDREDA